MGKKRRDAARAGFITASMRLPSSSPHLQSAISAPRSADPGSRDGSASAGISYLAKVFCVPVADDVCDREGARTFVMGALRSGCESSLPVAGNQRLIRANAWILELVLEGDSRWLEAQ